MDKDMVRLAIGSLESRSTDELLNIQKENDTLSWTREAFEAVGRILEHRGSIAATDVPELPNSEEAIAAHGSAIPSQIWAVIMLAYACTEIASLFDESIRHALGPGGLGMIFTVPAAVASIAVLCRQRWGWWFALVTYILIAIVGVPFGRTLPAGLAALAAATLLVNRPGKW